jgi:hypothetical protein
VILGGGGLQHRGKAAGDRRLRLHAPKRTRSTILLVVAASASCQRFGTTFAVAAARPDRESRLLRAQDAGSQEVTADRPPRSRPGSAAKQRTPEQRRGERAVEELRRLRRTPAHARRRRRLVPVETIHKISPMSFASLLSARRPILSQRCLFRWRALLVRQQYLRHGLKRNPIPGRTRRTVARRSTRWNNGPPATIVPIRPVGDAASCAHCAPRAWS